MTKKIILVVLDGWGERGAAQDNAIHLAKTPNWDHFKSIGHFVPIEASGEAVGLPAGQIGNSEVGHMHIGAGRIISQELTRINEAIHSNALESNPTLNDAFKQVIEKKSCLHILGLCSSGGVHAHTDHYIQLIKLLKNKIGSQSCYLHAFLDGRDTPPQSARTDLSRLQKEMTQSNIQFASLTGRYYAMDRDQRWERTQRCYDLLTTGETSFVDSDPIQALESAYARGETDEFVQPTRLSVFKPIAKDDVVIFMNFRADRARALCQALTDKNFNGFNRKVFPKIQLCTLTQYQNNLDAAVIFKPQQIKNTLGEVIANQNLAQLRMAETEKYAHVTFFFNGGREKEFPNETRKLIASLKVDTYDLKPEMSALELTKTLCETIKQNDYALTVVNYANADMVGHTGKLSATVKAIETIDYCLGRLYQTAAAIDANILITADHGNAEQLFDEIHQQPHTAHTCYTVPCLYLDKHCMPNKKQGSLIDIAPTILALMDIAIPKEMTGDILFKKRML